MVSVIIITYQRTQYITRAINSVLNQTYKDFELIVVDDNNPKTRYREEMENIMLQYKNKENVKYIQHDCNKNGAAARNTGIFASQGKYIAFLDDDDYFLPKRLEELTKLLDKNASYKGVYSSVIVTQNKKIIGLVEAKRSGNMKKELLLDQFAFGTGSNLFFRSDVVKGMNGFDTSFRRHQDIEFMLRYFNDNELIACYSPTVIKVQDDRSNEADLDKIINIKKNYFKVFAHEIEKLNSREKNIFYNINLSQILTTAICAKKYNRFMKLKVALDEYIDFNTRSYFRFFLLFINNYIKIENIKYFFVRKRVNKKFKDEVRMIKLIEKTGL